MSSTYIVCTYYPSPLLQSLVLTVITSQGSLSLTFLSFVWFSASPYYYKFYLFYVTEDHSEIVCMNVVSNCIESHLKQYFNYSYVQ